MSQCENVFLCLRTRKKYLKIILHTDSQSRFTQAKAQINDNSSTELRYVQGLGGAPNHFLGFKKHEDERGFVVRVIEPEAQKIFFIPIDGRACKEMDKVDERGFFELHLADYDFKTDYILESFYSDGSSRKWKDPYSIDNFITNKDLQDFNAGCDRRPFTKLGAIPGVQWS